MMRVLSAICRNTFGREIGIKQWLADSRDLQPLPERLGQENGKISARIPLAPQQALYPVTAAQERLWTLHKMYPESVYIICRKRT
ncbi:hypothetical protein P4S72_07810 [Vibrio sp. PP-XX7]